MSDEAIAPQKPKASEQAATVVTKPLAEGDGAQQAPPRQVSDEEFAPERDRWTKENERLSEKYDTVIKGLQDAVADPFPQDLAKREEQLRTRYDELRLRVSELRKAGKDMLIPALVLRQFPAKIMMAHATRDPKDYEIVRILLDQAKYEIDDAENQPVVDVRKEVLRMAGIDDAPKEQQGTLKKAPQQQAAQREVT